MSTDLFVALLTYALVTSITPGPNNFMLLASGVNFGFWRTVPQMLGISVGFASLLIGVGCGLGALLIAFPALDTSLKVAGGGYLLYLSWRIASSRSLATNGEGAARPMTLLESAAFQWVNPKAWVMAVVAMAAYTNPERPFLSVAIVVVRLHAGEPAERLGLGRIRHGHARLPGRSDAAQMVQHRDGRAAGGNDLAHAQLNRSIAGLASISQKHAAGASSPASMPMRASTCAAQSHGLNFAPCPTIITTTTITTTSSTRWRRGCARWKPS